MKRADTLQIRMHEYKEGLQKEKKKLQKEIEMLEDGVGSYDPPLPDTES